MCLYDSSVGVTSFCAIKTLNFTSLLHFRCVFCEFPQKNTASAVRTYLRLLTTMYTAHCVLVLSLNITPASRYGLAAVINRAFDLASTRPARCRLRWPELCRRVKCSNGSPLTARQRPAGVRDSPVDSAGPLFNSC